MAPEVITNSSFTTASDIWSFGILIHQMVTKKKPFAEGLYQNCLTFQRAKNSRCATENRI
jgi:serine/threonine protein kinase